LVVAAQKLWRLISNGNLTTNFQFFNQSLLINSRELEFAMVWVSKWVVFDYDYRRLGPIAGRSV
jgi:hypothetical protein